MNLNTVLSKFDGMAENIEKYIIDFLIAVGERCCEVARATKTYTDKTGRLTASIGYGVYNHSQLVKQGGFGGGEGEDEGTSTLRRVASEITQNPTLIVVAGMHYAPYVERRGYAVLDGARIRVEDIAKSIIKNLSI